MNIFSTSYIRLRSPKIQSLSFLPFLLLSWKSSLAYLAVLLFFIGFISPEAQAQSKRQIFEALPSVGLISVGNTMLAEITADSSQPELRIGFFAGGQSSTAVVKNLNSPGLQINPTPRDGFHVGARLEMEFAGPLFFLIEFEYARKGINSSFVSGNDVRRKEQFKFDYLDIPILFRVETPILENVGVEECKLSAGFGAHIGLLLSSTRITQIAEQEIEQSLDDGWENFDFGLEGRVGIIYGLMPRWNLTADLRYLHGLQNIIILNIVTEERSWRSRSLLVSAGVSYELQRSIR